MAVSARAQGRNLFFLWVKIDPQGERASWRLPGGEEVGAPKRGVFVETLLREESSLALISMEQVLGPRGERSLLSLVTPEKVQYTPEEAFTGPLKLPRSWREGNPPEGWFLTERKAYRGGTLLEATRSSTAEGPGPRGLIWDSTGALIHEKWYREGLAHREDGPADVDLRSSGRVLVTWSLASPEGGREALSWGPAVAANRYLRATLPLEEASHLVLKVLGGKHEEFFAREVYGDDTLGKPPMAEPLRRIVPALLETFFVEEYLAPSELYGEMPYSWWAPLLLGEARARLLEAWEALGPAGEGATVALA